MPIDAKSLGFNNGFGDYTGLGPITNSLADSEKAVSQADDVDKSKESTTTATADVRPSDDTKKTSLVDKLRAERESRAAKAKQETETLTLRDEVNKLKKELESERGLRFEDDPAGYIRARKLTPEAQLLLGETLLYDLAPDKAPPDLRFKLFEQKQVREAKEKEAKAQVESQAAELRRTNDAINNFSRDLQEGIKSFPGGTYPESEDWFSNDTGDMDYDAYCKSLLATASNLATKAKQAGTVADLSPSNIAKTLEAALTFKQANREKRRGARQPKQTDTKSRQSDESIDTTSTRGLNTKGKAEDLTLSDYERVQRAIRAGFGS